MALNQRWVSTGVSVVALVFSGCAGEAMDSGDWAEAEGEDLDALGSIEEVDSIAEAVTGSNPLIDAEFVRELPVLTGGKTYTDIGVSSTSIQLAWSNGQVETRRISDWVQTGLTSTVGTHIDYIEPFSDWGVISANDTTRKISRKVTNVPVTMGSYPEGVSYVGDITGYTLSSTRLRVVIAHSDGRGGTVMRMGTHDRGVSPAVIQWEATTYPLVYYGKGLNHAYDKASKAQLFRLLDYTTSAFFWYDRATGAKLGSEKLSPYTEHAYLHWVDGEYDRFGPGAFDQSPDGYFYGLDNYKHSVTGRAATVLARLHRDNLKP